MNLNERTRTQWAVGATVFRAIGQPSLVASHETPRAHTEKEVLFGQSEDNGGALGPIACTPIVAACLAPRGGATGGGGWLAQRRCVPHTSTVVPPVHSRPRAVLCVRPRPRPGSTSRILCRRWACAVRYDPTPRIVNSKLHGVF